MSTDPLFDAPQAAWMQSGAVSVTVASRDAANRPAIGASFGCRISSDRRLVTVFLGQGANGELLAALRAGSAIAVVVTESHTTRSVQLKGAGASEAALEPGDRERMRSYVGALAQTWAAGGQPVEWTRALFDPDGDEIVAVVFTPYVAFDQAPGPRAGTVLTETA
jgi:hypothetical protein